MMPLSGEEHTLHSHCEPHAVASPRLPSGHSPALLASVTPPLSPRTGPGLGVGPALGVTENERLPETI